MKSTQYLLGAIILLLLFGMSIAIGNLYITIMLPSSGIVASVNLQCSISAIDWGTLSPGDNKTTIFNITSLSNINLTLHMTTGNFTPAGAEIYLDITWNLENTVIIPNETLSANVTLVVDPDITKVDNFNFDIIITAES